ncbi:MAG: hypothetical protein Q4C77_04260 [Eubacteriales bacterium]|nr:hypothetical protein [Eubacteriales bacterium]
MKQLNGNEEFTLRGESSGITVNEFWSWAYSDLLNNTYRGVLAEFLVEKSLSGNAPPRTQMRVNWTPYDLISATGRRIEVKSAAYLQSWERDYYSKILFNIAPRRAWHPDTGYSPESSRHSDLYVFCVYTAKTREQSILDLDLWDFYVLPTSVLNQECPGQKTISFDSLLKLQPAKADFLTLGNTIETIEL